MRSPGLWRQTTFYACVLGCAATLHGQTPPAFPGAEGFGAGATGGRGGKVYHVTTLNDSGPGSLRDAVSAPHRTVVFDVSGTINLRSNLKIRQPFLTIAGQTAPGDGITLKGWLTSVQDTHDVVIRYLRCRPGDVNCPTFQDDAFHFVNATNCIADHLTASWSIDEVLSCTHSTNITVQWCIIGASLNDSCHDKGPHGYGTLLRYGAGRVTYHHNLYIHNRSRNPRLGDNIHLDFVNNVIYDWGGTAGYNANDSGDNPGGFTNALNYVNNYLIAGPSTSSHFNTAFSSGVADSASCEIYQSGNRIDSNRDSWLNGTDTGWGMFSGRYTRETSPFAAPAVTTNSASVAYEEVLAFVGDSAVRDAVDRLIVSQVQNQTGEIINSEAEEGGWPLLNSAPAPADSDGDGIPDYWEQAMGWSTSVPNDDHLNADGYTDLEWYLNWLASPHAVCDRNGSVAVDLPSVTGDSTNLTFALMDGTNGAVKLDEDGHTARFTATNNFSGLASFSFDAIDSRTGIGFGPVTVSVLVSTTNAPVRNTPPVLAPIPNRTILAGRTLVFTNRATDTDQPPQTLTYSLGNAPDGATVSANGVFDWRPAIEESGTSNYLDFVATDNGSPRLSTTQAFSVMVNRPASPQLESPAADNGSFRLRISGDRGPDYTVQTSTNLTIWSDLFTTNPPSLPFDWNEPASHLDRRFYRIRLGP